MKKKKKYDTDDYNSCLYCTHSGTIAGGELLLCEKKGLVSPDSVCRRFELDLLSLNPQKLRTIRSTLSEEDFKL